MAGKRGERTENRVADGETPPGPSRYRACLIVSLIVLVWNVGATWRHFLFGDTTSSLSPADSRRDSGLLQGAQGLPAVDCAVSGQAGPLNVRQNFLLGRKVDINRAGRGEISGLPGISDRVAGSVVEARSRMGGFRRPEDLLLVKGIKEKKLKKILPFLSGFHNN